MAKESSTNQSTVSRGIWTNESAPLCLDSPGEFLHVADETVSVDRAPTQHQAGQLEISLPAKLEDEAVDDPGVGVDLDCLQVDLNFADVFAEQD